MRVTIIPSSNVVVIGGVAHEVDCSAFLAIHAVQWKDTNGEIEFEPVLEDGVLITPSNEPIVSLTQFQSLIDAWQFVEDHPPPPPPPTPEELRAQLFEADTVRKNLVDQLKTATPDQIKTYIQNNVTDLASARVMLTRMALAIALLVRR